MSKSNNLQVGFQILFNESSKSKPHILARSVPIMVDLEGLSIQNVVDKLAKEVDISLYRLATEFIEHHRKDTIKGDVVPTDTHASFIYNLYNSIANSTKVCVKSIEKDENDDEINILIKLGK